MKKTNYFLNFIRSYRNIFFKVIFFEIFYSIRFGSIIPRMKIQNNNNRTDTIPCIYYFIYEISKFVKEKNKISCRYRFRVWKNCKINKQNE